MYNLFNTIGRERAPGERQILSMFCPICGKENPEGSTFCASCGKPLTAPTAPAPAPAPAPAAASVAAPAAAAPAAPQQPVPQAQPQPQPQYAAPAAPAAPAKKSPILPFGQFFKSLITAAIKPVTGASDEAKKYDHIGNSVILSAIVVGILTIVSFLSSVLTTTINHSWPRSVGSIFVRLIRSFMGSLLDFALMTFGFAAIMLLIGLIIKEKWSFSRLLSICAMAIFPSQLVRALITSYLTSFSINYTWFYTTMKYLPLTTILSSAATIYSFILLYEGITRETKLDGNKKGFVYAIAYIALQFVAHYIGLIY